MKTKVTAIGIYDGEKMMVEGVRGEDGEWHFMVNGACLPHYEAIIKKLMGERPTIGGTYYPKTGTAMNVAAVFSSALFFDRGTTQITIVGDADEETMPSEPGVIY